MCGCEFGLFRRRLLLGHVTNTGNSPELLNLIEAAFVNEAIRATEVRVSTVRCEVWAKYFEVRLSWPVSFYAVQVIPKEDPWSVLIDPLSEMEICKETEVLGPDKVLSFNGLLSVPFKI